jgi:hypothetical protein
MPQPLMLFNARRSRRPDDAAMGSFCASRARPQASPLPCPQRSIAATNLSSPHAPRGNAVFDAPRWPAPRLGKPQDAERPRSVPTPSMGTSRSQIQSQSEVRVHSTLLGLGGARGQRRPPPAQKISFPRSAWECRVRRSASASATAGKTPGRGASQVLPPRA